MSGYMPCYRASGARSHHQFWAAHRNRDLAALDKLIDDDAISTDDGGTRTGKQEALTAVKKPEGNLHTETDEQPGDFRVVFQSLLNSSPPTCCDQDRHEKS